MREIEPVFFVEILFFNSIFLGTYSNEMVFFSRIAFVFMTLPTPSICMQVMLALLSWGGREG